MDETSKDAPRRLKASEALVLEYLREHADEAGCAAYTKAELEAALGLARSTLAVAVGGLRELGVLSVDQSAGKRSNVYCVQPSDSAAQPSDSTVQPSDPNRPIVPSDSDRLRSDDAPPPASAAATRAGVEVPPTPLDVSAATRSGDPLAHVPAPAREGQPSDAQPSDSATVPIGRLAVAAAADAARASGRVLDRGVAGRLGRAAQNLAGEHDVADILGAARRIGEGAGDDLYTAIRAVERSAPLPRSVRSEHDADRYADLQRRAEASRQARDPLHLGRLKAGEIVEAEALYVGTYGERRRFDPELWARELRDYPIGAILWGIRAMAKASPHPPTWGEVAGAVTPTLEHERRKRQNAQARQRETERMQARA